MSDYEDIYDDLPEINDDSDFEDDSDDQSDISSDEEDIDEDEDHEELEDIQEEDEEDFENLEYDDTTPPSDQTEDATSSNTIPEDVVKEVKIKKNKYFGLPILTKFEKARVLGVRTEQIIAGGKIFVETNSEDPYEIALEELYQKKMPLLIRRWFGKKHRDISVNDLKLLD